MSERLLPAIRRLGGLAAILLLIEFADELVFGLGESAWPLIRRDLGLNYAQIGILLSVPGLLAAFFEPFFGIWADKGHKRWLVLAGGAGFVVATLVTGFSPTFAVLLLAFILFFPASGAFVSVSQAVLMDSDPQRMEQQMARWTLAGSVGVVAGPILLAVLGWAGLSWRSGYMLVAVVAGLLVLAVSRTRFPRPQQPDGDEARPAGLRAVIGAFRRSDVRHWLVLLMFSDFMLDFLLSYTALYFVDVVGATPEQGALAVGVFTGVGLLSDALIIPVLTRVSGLRYLAWSAGLMTLAYPAFLLIQGLLPKLVLLGLIGLLNAGWYAILKAQMYGTMPGQSGTVLAVDSIFGFVEKLVPLGLGLLAARFGLSVALWVLAIGPLFVWFGVLRPPVRPTVVVEPSPEMQGLNEGQG